MVSILDSIKKLLGIEADDTSFDEELIIDINSVFMVLNQLNVGPPEGFSISDNTAEWSDFIGERGDIGLIKSYVYLKIKLMFDPPQNSFLVNSIDEQCKEFEWRINVQAENTQE